MNESSHCPARLKRLLEHLGSRWGPDTAPHNCGVDRDETLSGQRLVAVSPGHHPSQKGQRPDGDRDAYLEPRRYRVLSEHKGLEAIAVVMYAGEFRSA